MKVTPLCETADTADEIDLKYKLGGLRYEMKEQREKDH